MVVPASPLEMSFITRVECTLKLVPSVLYSNRISLLGNPGEELLGEPSVLPTMNDFSSIGFVNVIVYTNGLVSPHE